MKLPKQKPATGRTSEKNAKKPLPKHLRNVESKIKEDVRRFKRAAKLDRKKQGKLRKNVTHKDGTSGDAMSEVLRIADSFVADGYAESFGMEWPRVEVYAPPVPPAMTTRAGAALNDSAMQPRHGNR